VALRCDVLVRRRILALRRLLGCRRILALRGLLVALLIALLVARLRISLLVALLVSLLVALLLLLVALLLVALLVTLLVLRERRRIDGRAARRAGGRRRLVGGRGAAVPEPLGARPVIDGAQTGCGNATGDASLLHGRRCLVHLRLRWRVLSLRRGCGGGHRGGLRRRRVLPALFPEQEEDGQDNNANHGYEGVLGIKNTTSTLGLEYGDLPTPPTTPPAMAPTGVEEPPDEAVVVDDDDVVTGCVVVGLLLLVVERVAMTEVGVVLSPFTAKVE